MDNLYNLFDELNFLSLTVLFLGMIAFLAIIIQVVYNLINKVKARKQLKIRRTEEERLRKKSQKLMTGYTD